MKIKYMELTLWEHQRSLIELNPDKYGLWHDCGLGKSLSLIMLAKQKGDKALILCPLSIVEKWQRDCIKFELDADVISKEQFKIKCQKGLIDKYNTVIIDEVQYWGSPKSQLFKTTYAYLKTFKPNHIYLATATPYTSSCWSVYCLLLLLGKDIPYHKWMNTFFFKIKMGRIQIPKERKEYNGKPMSSVMGEFLSECGEFLKMEDAKDVPEQTFQEEYFELTADQRKAFDKHLDLNPIVNFSRQLQIANGTLKTEDGYETFKSTKLQRVLDIIDVNKKLIVVCKHRAEMELISKEVKKPCFLIHGDVKNRDEVIKMANNSEECVVLVNAYCSAGYELSDPTVGRDKDFNLMVFYSMSYSYTDFYQICRRILRGDNLKKNSYISLVVKDSPDYRVWDCVYNKKQDFHEKMINN